MSEETTSTERQDSIKLIKNSKGYNWEVKRYYDFSETKPEAVIKQLQNIDKELNSKVGGGSDVE